MRKKKENKENKEKVQHKYYFFTFHVNSGIQKVWTPTKIMESMMHNNLFLLYAAQR